MDIEAPSSERRRSGRGAGRKSYAEAESDEDAEIDAGDEETGAAVDQKPRQNGISGAQKAMILSDDSDEALSDPPDSEEGEQ